MDNTLDTRRIVIFLAFAFGIAWAAALVIYLTGGLIDSRVLVDLPGFKVTVALVLVTLVFMPAPAIAHVLTRLITKEGWQDTYLRPKLKKGWPFWLAAWFLPGLMVIAGMVVYFLIFPQHYDPELTPLLNIMQAQLEQLGQAPTTIDANLWVIIVAQTGQALLLAPVINALPTFGEEFGWRAYLQPRLMALGGRKAMLMMGVIWGVWHWPIILMGHNFGLEYPGAPFLGPLAMVWFTFTAGTFLGWVTLKGRSVWPAVIGHAALNGMANLPVVFIQGNPNPLVGPLVVGVIGGVFFTIAMLIIFFVPGALDAPQEGQEEPVPA